MPQRKMAKIYFKTIQNLKLEIDTLELDLETRRSERKRLIDSNYPIDVHSINYDNEIKAKAYKDDDLMFNRLLILATEIPYLETTLEDKRKEFAELKKMGYKSALKAEDKVMQVFNLAYHEGKKNPEIAEIMGMSMSWVEHVKTDLNQIFNEHLP